jgi:Lrp/AsnC family leucine-responsive transcriptional regulator
MAHLEQVTGRLATLGSITTSIVYSSALEPRSIKPYMPKNTEAPVLRSL